MTTLTRPAFEPHYHIYLTYENEDGAHAEGLPELPYEGQRIVSPSGERTPELDRAAVTAAITLANAQKVGAEGRVVFKEYCAYVTFKETYGESELLATVVRAYSWDTDKDYTFAKPHNRNIPYDVVAELETQLGAG